MALPKGVSKKGVHWVEPRLVAQVRYAEWTSDAILRHSSFEGLREDKRPEEVMHDPVKIANGSATASDQGAASTVVATDPHPPDAAAPGPGLSSGTRDGGKRRLPPKTRFPQWGRGWLRAKPGDE